MGLAVFVTPKHAFQDRDPRSSNNLLADSELTGSIINLLWEAKHHRQLVASSEEVFEEFNQQSRIEVGTHRVYRPL